MWLLIVHLYALVITWHWLRTAAPKIQDPTDSPALSSNEQSPSTAGPSKPNSPSEADGTNHGSTSQTTAQDTNPSIRATFNVRTFLLYGVLATSRSWLIGVRKLVRLEHAKMLALKVAGPHLPQELVDAIVAELVALDAPIIEHKIATDDKAFAWNREDARASTPNEREVQRQIVRSSRPLPSLERTR